MSRRNWFSLFAVVGWLTGSTVSAQQAQNPPVKSEPITTRQPDKDNSDQTGTDDQKQYATDNITPALNKIEAAIRDLKAKQTESDEKWQKNREIADLNAQQDMAFWAKLMFWITSASTSLSVAGIILVWRSLFLNRDAVNAAINANQLTANSQRAWVTIDIYSAATESSDPDEIITIKARLSNLGKMPAVDLCESFYAYYPPTDTAIKSFFDGAYKHKVAGIGSGTLVPGETRDRNVFRITRTGVPHFEQYGGVCQVILGCVYDVPGRKAFSIKHLIVQRGPNGFICTTVKTDYV